MTDEEKDRVAMDQDEPGPLCEYCGEPGRGLTAELCVCVNCETVVCGDCQSESQALLGVCRDRNCELRAIRRLQESEDKLRAQAKTMHAALVRIRSFNESDAPPDARVDGDGYPYVFGACKGVAIRALAEAGEID
jgi:hypothetical protein